MFYNGERFGDELTPKFFASRAVAFHHARDLIRNNPKLKRYQVAVLGTSSKGSAEWRMNRLTNPSERGDSVDRARKLLHDFSGHEGTKLVKVHEPEKDTGLVVGTLDGVLYTTVRDGRTEKYIHRFAKKSRPLLAATSDGKRLRIVGGRFRFTEAGIIDT